LGAEVVVIRVRAKVEKVVVEVEVAKVSISTRDPDIFGVLLLDLPGGGLGHPPTNDLLDVSLGFQP
jgi:hypothetical protein